MTKILHHYFLMRSYPKYHNRRSYKWKLLCNPNSWLLQFFTCVSWGISPAQILLIMQTTAIHHSIFYFSSFSMFTQSRISKSIVICSFCSFFFFYPLYHFHPTLFYSSFYSLFCFLPVYSLYFLISLIVFFQICYPLFFLFSYYSILPASPLCSIPIQSVLFLLVFILLDPSI